MTAAQMLDRPGGRIACDVRGDGPLVVCVPGMGELRSAYRFTVPALTAAGLRVATMDLRGHGDSDATFTSWDEVAAGSDVLALIERLGGPAVVAGTTRTSHAPARERLPRVTGKPVLIVMGEKDPDFPDPRAEAEWIRGTLDAGLLLVPGAGHYPQAETPDVVNPALVRFCQDVTAGA